MTQGEATEALARLAQAQGDEKTALELLAQGADPNGVCGDENTTPLIEAVTWNHLAMTRALLDHGGDIGTRLASEPWESPSAFSLIRARPLSPAIWISAAAIGFMNLTTRALPYDMDMPDRTVESECHSRAMARLLVQYGADPAAFDSEYRAAALGTDLIEAQEITPDVFQAHFAPREGTANPERVENPFWLEQMRTGRSGYAGGQAAMGRKHSSLDTGAVWSFDRFGQSATRLPDGRLVVIAGEHEDSYDPDFHIYNDVTVIGPNGAVEHYIYPRDVFPPTDFHSATLIGDAIWLIGSLGYSNGRHPNVTRVLRLNLADFSVGWVETTGDNPGWINHHRAALVGGEIHVWGGKVEPGYADLKGRFALDTGTRVWRRVS